MTQISGKTYWLVGASEGLGRSLAERLHAKGAQLILSARSADRLQELADQLPGARALPCDVTDAASVEAAAHKAGTIDAMIYCVGAYTPMRATAWDTAETLTMTEVNYTGALRILGAVLPDMLARGAGDITLVGSLSAYRGLPAAIGYGASKAALASLAETMRHDLKGTGVTVRLTNPGFIKTRLTAKNDFKMPMLMTPEKAADHIMRALQSRRFRTDFPAPFSWAIRAYNMAPDWLVYWGK